jgi:hypothetical protein
VFFLGRRRGEHVSCSVIDGVINGAAQALFDVPAGPVVWHVDVPWLWVVVVITRKCGGCPVAGKENVMGLEVSKGM